MGAYSSWTLIRGWALNRINTVNQHHCEGLLRRSREIRICIGKERSILVVNLIVKDTNEFQIKLLVCFHGSNYGDFSGFISFFVEGNFGTILY